MKRENARMKKQNQKYFWIGGIIILVFTIVYFIGFKNDKIYGLSVIDDIILLNYGRGILNFNDADLSYGIYVGQEGTDPTCFDFNIKYYPILDLNRRLLEGGLILNINNSLYYQNQIKYTVFYSKGWNKYFVCSYNYPYLMVALDKSDFENKIIPNIISSVNMYVPTTIYNQTINY